MAAVSVLAKDLKTNTIVHIDDLAEGYSSCVCPSCGEQMIAANHNPESRQVSTYFRHAGSRICTSETALHLYAKQVIEREQKVILPAFQTAIELKNTDGAILSRQISIPSSLAQLYNIELEKTLSNSSRKPDVSAEDRDADELFIEIKVHHEVDTQKASELQGLDLDVIEINLHDLLERKILAKADIDKAVIEEAPRMWISQQRFNDRIASLRSELQKEVDRDNQSIAEDAKAVKKAAERLRKQKSEAKQKWRDEHQEQLKLIDSYSQTSNRKKALEALTYRLSQSGNPENLIYRFLMEEFGRIPNIVNIPIKGELAFKAHRAYWQSLIFRDVICKVYDQTSKKIEGQRKRYRRQFYGYETAWLAELPGITPKGVYDYLQSKVLLNKVAYEFEGLAGEYLQENFGKRPDGVRYVTTKEYEVLPKPVPAIRRYLTELAKIGILDPSGDVYYIPYQKRPNMGIQVNSYDAIMRKGMEQYN